MQLAFHCINDLLFRMIIGQVRSTSDAHKVHQHQHLLHVCAIVHGISDKELQGEASHITYFFQIMLVNSCEVIGVKL